MGRFTKVIGKMTLSMDMESSGGPTGNTIAGNTKMTVSMARESIRNQTVVVIKENGGMV